MISIIVPVYNAEKTLNRCIDSILSQTYQDWELLLINDGSRDDSLAISKEYALSDKRIKVFDKANGGVSSARNMGLDNANGNWITFVDADDYIGDHYFDEIPNREEDLIVYQLKSFSDEFKQVIPIPHAPVGTYVKEFDFKKFIEKHLRTEELLSPWGKFFKVALIGNLRFLKGQCLGEDTIFVQSYLRGCASLTVSNKSQYYYYDVGTDFCLKYRMHINEAKTQLTNIYKTYLQLEIECQEFVSFELELFRKVCAEEIYKDSRLWYCDNRIQDVYNACKGFMGLKGYIKYSIFKIPIIYKRLAKYLR